MLSYGHDWHLLKTRVQNARHYSKREFTKQRHSLQKYLWKKVKHEASEQGVRTRLKFTGFQHPQQCYSQWPQGGDHPKVQQLMTAVQPFSGLLFIHKKEWNSDSCFMDEVWKHYAEWKEIGHKKSIHSIIPFIWRVQNCKIHRNSKYICICQENREWLSVCTGSFWGANYYEIK